MQELSEEKGEWYTATVHSPSWLNFESNKNLIDVDTKERKTTLTVAKKKKEHTHKRFLLQNARYLLTWAGKNQKKIFPL